MNLRKGRTALIGAAAGLLALTTALPANAATVTTILDDELDGTPFGLAVGSDGTLYVAQSGESGSVGALRKGSFTQIATGLPGLVAGVDAKGRGTATYLVSTPGGPLGLVNVGNPSGTTRTLANVSAYETANNPDQGNSYGFQNLPVGCDVPPDFQATPGDIDSNAYAVAILANGDRVVADAGANALLRVRANGAVSTLAVMPPRPLVITDAMADAFGLPACVVDTTFNFQFVPTDVEVGPGGMLYVSSLPGGPEGPEGAVLGARGAVFTVNPSTRAVAQFASGFAGATDLAVAPNGTVYVTELFAGRVSMASPGGPVPVADIPEAVSVEYAKGKLYVGAGVFGAPPSVMTVTP